MFQKSKIGESLIFDTKKYIFWPLVEFYTFIHETNTTRFQIPKIGPEGLKIDREVRVRIIQSELESSQSLKKVRFGGKSLGRREKSELFK